MTLILLFQGHRAAIAADWKPFFENPAHTSYYNSDSLIDTGSAAKQVIIKVIYSNRGKEDMIYNRNRAGLTIKGFEDFDHTEFFFEVDCKDRQSRILNGRHFNDKGDVFKSFATPNRPMRDVDKDPGTQALFQAVCPD